MSAFPPWATMPAARARCWSCRPTRLQTWPTRPDIAVVTNLFPEHAPWHGTVDNYFRDKLRLLTLGDGTRKICNFADARLRAACDGMSIDWFNAPTGYDVKDGTLRYEGERVDCASFPLKGEHNLSNLAAACTAADILGIHGGRHRVDLASFRQLRHRLEEFVVGGPPGLLCVNDSISTVPQATIAALEAYPDRPTVPLLGGTDRGQDYAELLDLLPRTRVKAIVLLPPNGARIEAQMQGHAMARQGVPRRPLRAGRQGSAAPRRAR